MIYYTIKKTFFCTKTELLNFKFIMPFAKLNIVGSRPVLNGSFFSDDIPVDIQLLNFLLLSNIRKLIIGVETRKF